MKGRRQMSDYVTEVNDANFESGVLESSRPVLIDFWDEWCQPCNVLAPTVESLAEKYEDRLKVVKLNVDKGAGSSCRFGIKAIPTLILFRDGNEAQRAVGVRRMSKNSARLWKRACAQRRILHSRGDRPSPATA